MKTMEKISLYALQAFGVLMLGFVTSGIVVGVANTLAMVINK